MYSFEPLVTIMVPLVEFLHYACGSSLQHGWVHALTTEQLIIILLSIGIAVLTIWPLVELAIRM